MSEQSPSVELVRREAEAALERPLPPMTDGEVAAAYRTAKALADSGLFKDAKQPGQAFAKMLAGRDLGLTPFESMTALHVIEGKIEAGADLHATRVRQREGYDYRVWWLKVDGPPAQEGGLPKVDGVAADEEHPADMREVYGCAIEFLVDGERRGIGRWTQADTARAGLAGKDNHRKYPRSMYFARAMSQGVSLHVPEVMGGLRVYAPDEIPRAAPDELTGGQGADEVAMDDLPTAVEAVLARARELGHAGLANRESAVMATRGRAPEVIGQWVTRATRELNRVARGHAPSASNEAAESEQPAEAEVVADAPAQNEAVSASDPADPPTDTPEGDAAQQSRPVRAERDESAEVVDGEAVHAPGHAAEHVQALEQRARDLAARIEQADDPGSVEVGELHAELEAVETELDAATNPQQRSFGV